MLYAHLQAVFMLLFHFNLCVRERARSTWDLSERSKQSTAAVGHRRRRPVAFSYAWLDSAASNTKWLLQSANFYYLGVVDVNNASFFIPHFNDICSCIKASFMSTAATKWSDYNCVQQSPCSFFFPTWWFHSSINRDYNLKLTGDLHRLGLAATHPT